MNRNMTQCNNNNNIVIKIIENGCRKIMILMYLIIININQEH